MPTRVSPPTTRRHHFFQEASASAWTIWGLESEKGDEKKKRPAYPEKGVPPRHSLLQNRSPFRRCGVWERETEGGVLIGDEKSLTSLRDPITSAPRFLYRGRERAKQPEDQLGVKLLIGFPNTLNAWPGTTKKGDWWRSTLVSRVVNRLTKPCFIEEGNDSRSQVIRPELLVRKKRDGKGWKEERLFSSSIH